MINLKEARSFLGVTVSKTRYSARETRGLDFTIDIEYIMDLLVYQHGKCALTGWDLEFTRGGSYGYGTNPMGCTMDRKNNSEGYVKGNVQWVHVDINYAKLTLSNKDFIDMCRRVVEYNK